MKEIKPDNYTQTKKLICDWSDKINCLLHYRMLKFYVRHGMIVDKVYNIISFEQSRWLLKYRNFNTQNEIRLLMIMKRISINYSITRFMVRLWKMSEIV